MNEKNKESILQEFRKKIQPSIQKISTFIDESNLVTREKNSLSKIYSSYQSAIKDTENAISNNQPPNDIIQIASNIDNEFTRFYKRLSYFLEKEQDAPKIPDIISEAQLCVQESINFLSQAINQTSFQDQEQELNNDDKIPDKRAKKRRKKIDQSYDQENELVNTNPKNHNAKDIKNSDLNNVIKELKNSDKKVLDDTKSKNINVDQLKDMNSKDIDSKYATIKSKNDNKDKFDEEKSINISEKQHNDKTPKIINEKQIDDTKSKSINKYSPNDAKSKNTNKEKNKEMKFKNINSEQINDFKSQNINEEQPNPIITQNDNKTKLDEKQINDTKSKNINKESPNNTKTKKESKIKLNQVNHQEQTHKKDETTIQSSTESEISPKIKIELSTKDKKELLNQIKILTNEIESCNLRSKILEKKHFDLTQKSSDWTESHINEPCNDPDTELFDILFEQQDTLNARIKKLSDANDEINIQIDEETAQMNKTIRDLKNREDEVNKEIDEFIRSNSQTRLTKSNLDKEYFDMKMEVNDIEKLFKIEQRTTENSNNHLLQMAERVSFIEESNKDIRSKIRFYNEKSAEIENEIQLMKSRKITSQTEILYQKMQDAEIDLLKTRKEYETLVNSTIPDLKYKLNRITEEINHLASLNRIEQEETEPTNLQYIKDQIFNVFKF